jgi:predicted ATP-dependent endonuclease of OLD family
MFQVQLTSFRCFAKTAPLEVLPITFLVGENSAGKTTLLAAVRLLLQIFTRSPQNPFNSDPYYLDCLRRQRKNRAA